MTKLFRTSLTTSVCLLVLLTSIAGAQAQSDETATSMARERFKEGVQYFDQKQYDRARVAFLQAFALKRHPAVLLNLAHVGVWSRNGGSGAPASMVAMRR